MRKEKSNLRTRSREVTNIQQTSDRERGKEKGYCRLSAHTSALLISQPEVLPLIASPPAPLCGYPLLLEEARLSLDATVPGKPEKGKDWMCIKELMPEKRKKKSQMNPSKSSVSILPLTLQANSSCYLDIGTLQVIHEVEPSFQILFCPCSQVGSDIVPVI